MKLYATTTSERASKGQGGNKELTIDILAQELDGIPTRTNLFKLSLTIENNQLKAELLDYTEGDTIRLYPRHASTPPQTFECDGKHKTVDDLFECEECEKFFRTEKAPGKPPTCPKCKSEIWDVAKGHKLNKCWSCGLSFDSVGNVAGQPNALEKLFESLPEKDKQRK